VESLEESGPHSRRETAVDLGDVLERARLVIAYQDRIKGSTARVYPPIVKSRLCRTRIFCHVADRWPGLYALSRRFATMPANPCSRIRLGAGSQRGPAGHAPAFGFIMPFHPYPAYLLLLLVLDNVTLICHLLNVISGECAHGSGTDDD